MRMKIQVQNTTDSCMNNFCFILKFSSRQRGLELFISCFTFDFGAYENLFHKQNVSNSEILMFYNRIGIYAYYSQLPPKNVLNCTLSR